MASASLMQANPLNRKCILPSILRRPILHVTCKSRLVFIRKLQNTRPSFTLKCVFSNKLPNNTASSNELQVAVYRNRILDAILKATEVFRQPAVVAVLMGALLMYDPHSASAAYGGRIGGRRFSSRSSLSSRRHLSRSSSCRSRSSWPNGDGVYVGNAVEFEVDDRWRLKVFGLYLMFMIVVVLVYKRSVMKLQIGLLGAGMSSLQKDLNWIAEVADTSTPEGLSYVLTATTLFLLQHTDYCISGYSSVDVNSRIIDVEKRFDKLSIEERGKFDEETLVNVNGVKIRQSRPSSGERCSNEYVVVTILVAAEGLHKLPSINGREDLKEALQKLASIPVSKTLAVEVLWTPQNENDVLSESEYLEDYPLLRPL